MIEQTQQKLLEIARDLLDLEDQFDHQLDARSQGERLMALDSLKEHTRTLYEAIVVLRHELSLAQESQDALAENNQTQEDMATFEPTLVSDQELDFELTPSRDDTPDFEPSTEKIKDIVAQMPAETQQVDELFQGITDGSPEAHEALAHYQEDIEFEPVPEASTSEPAPDSGPAPKSDVKSSTDSESTPVSEPASVSEPTTASEPASVSEPASGLNATIQKPKSVNDQWGRLSIGLNDRTAFVQHLFLGDIEGFNRVISQISTFDSLDEVGGFLENQVKPEYNNWETKEAVADRFMRLIQQRFNA